MHNTDARGPRPAVRVLSLCSGIGGLDMAHAANLVAVSEIDPDASTVLAARLPHIPNLGDWTALESFDEQNPTDITAGLPCQPVSEAGKGKGEADERWLYDDFAAILARSERRPTLWLENVPAICSARHAHALRRFLCRVAELGYAARWGVVAACAVGAVHLRRRWWCVAWHRELHSEPQTLRGDQTRPAGAFLNGRAAAARPEFCDAASVLSPTPTAADGTGAGRVDAGNFSGNAQMRDIPPMLSPTPDPAVSELLTGGRRPESGWRLSDVPVFLSPILPDTQPSQSAASDTRYDQNAVEVYLHAEHPDEQIHLLPALLDAGVRRHEIAHLAAGCAAWSSQIGWWTPTISHKRPDWPRNGRSG